MTEEKKETRNIMEEDMFASDFVTYKTIKVRNKKDPETFTKYKFGIKELTGFDEDKISKNAISVDSKTKQIELNQSKANIELIKKSIVEAPFVVNDENIMKLSKKVRNELLSMIAEVNEVSVETEKK